MAQHGNGIEERIKILEKAVINLGEALRKRDEDAQEISDILRELKALKVFLARTAPDFRRQFPEIQRKVK